MEIIDILQLTLTITALYIAKRALDKQTEEIIKNNKINTLTQSSLILQDQINYVEKLADSSIKNPSTQKTHRTNINTNLRPLKQEVDLQFLKEMNDSKLGMDLNRIRNAIIDKKEDRTN